MLHKNKKISIIFIGHFAVDTIIKHKQKRIPTLGGSVSYCSLSLSNYTDKVDIHIVSNVGKQNLNGKLLDPLKKQNVDLEGLNFVDEKNTNFVLEYHDHSRSLILNSKSPDIEFETFPKSYLNKNIDAIVLVPLCNEISESFVQKILEKFPNIYIGIDLQGFIRKIDNNGRVNIVPDDKIKKDVEMVIKSIGSKLILKGSEEEMKILSGKQDLMEVMQYFQNFKGTFIMTLGEKGSMITRNGKKIISIPAYKPNNVADETGAGDVYLAIFLYEYLNSKKNLGSIKRAANLASAAASFEIEKEGPIGFQSRLEVLKRVQSKKYTI